MLLFLFILPLFAEDPVLFCYNKDACDASKCGEYAFVVPNECYAISSTSSFKVTLTDDTRLKGKQTFYSDNVCTTQVGTVNAEITRTLPTGYIATKTYDYKTTGTTTLQTYYYEYVDVQTKYVLTTRGIVVENYNGGCEANDIIAELQTQITCKVQFTDSNGFLATFDCTPLDENALGTYVEGDANGLFKTSNTSVPKTNPPTAEKAEFVIVTSTGSAQKFVCENKLCRLQLDVPVVKYSEDNVLATAINGDVTQYFMSNCVMSKSAVLIGNDLHYVKYTDTDCTDMASATILTSISSSTWKPTGSDLEYTIKLVVHVDTSGTMYFSESDISYIKYTVNLCQKTQPTESRKYTLMAKGTPVDNAILVELTYTNEKCEGALYTTSNALKTNKNFVVPTDKQLPMYKLSEESCGLTNIEQANTVSYAVMNKCVEKALHVIEESKLTMKKFTDEKCSTGGVVQHQMDCDKCSNDFYYLKCDLPAPINPSDNSQFICVMVMTLFFIILM
ncbi:hypothetical protein EIN_281890 [Entamoeba invadens IP1]|uniref:Uncharacterized protein n=1 Tax=Entamoeba invadens IP1 TaxID=370355 RepID=A0A0A1TX30_ENTIV|nr:hypothetical protein EIN_281890 [Entamoeba invadens IP1]ELP85818.1 hypothetical protein EIN_281890 [Entamoeba invadens IP1]|eukprot:XP_004185164.1 hypothetical protein EIN_281890 [Entamoeba invadens IP1]